LHALPDSKALFDKLS